MQLKLCLLVVFVLNVSCVYVEKDPSALLNLFADVAPMPMNYSVKSPKNYLSSFAELFSSANPENINEAIRLLEIELSEANSSLNTLTDRVTETLHDYTEANTDFIDAQGTLQPQIEGFQDEIYRLQDLLKAAEDKAHKALGTYDLARHDFNNQSPNLEDEMRALQEAIEKLRPLQDTRHIAIVGNEDYSSHSSGNKYSECLPVNAVSSIGSNQWGNKLGVTCCISDGSQGSRPDCQQSKNWNEANAHCEAKGLRLCTEDEIRAGSGRGTGCNFDAYLVWTSTVCTGLPTLPSTPGCWIFFPSGCPNQSSWANDKDLTQWKFDTWDNAGSSKTRCDRRPQEYNSWCGVSDALRVFIPEN